MTCLVEWHRASGTGWTKDGYELTWSRWVSQCGKFIGGRIVLVTPRGRETSHYAPHIEMALERAGQAIVRDRADARGGKVVKQIALENHIVV